VLDVVAKTVRNEGILAMYQGLESTMWRHVLWNSGYFGCIFQVRQLLPTATNKKSQMTNDIIAGTVGGYVQLLSNSVPASYDWFGQHCRYRTQHSYGCCQVPVSNLALMGYSWQLLMRPSIQNTPRIAGQVPKYNWAWGAVGTVLKEEGFGALYKGFLPKVLRLGPGGG